jgi:hypothetical protein
MTYRDITSRSAVLKAIEEYDRLGQVPFLDRYGFGKARRYFLIYGGRMYDSKAIIGVAFGYQFPGLGPLTSGDFSGGEATVQRKLEELGFEVRVLPA